ncbi:hypothetical protein F4561_000588 [Lipingzhangella halophila]|uniref:DUF4307 domain-containing protein n=1 Tax=Lipingzhangella halophila TaxID=1783352 RepID=A0A7W7RDR2_9ACTN|nr:DUF4307 domain-containing protein [Lipingzhangella halophila]MBB4929768.1 hypothetical protein [Lipingzhangella halophila]
MPAPPPDTTPEPSAKGGRRYGNTPVIFVIGLLVAAVFTVGWGYALMNYSGNSGLQYQTIAWRVVSENEATVTFEVSGNEPAQCVVLAKDDRHVEVGQTNVKVAPGNRNLTTSVETVREASTVEVASCREQGSAK